MSAYELRILNESTGQYIPLAFIQGADGKDTFAEAQAKGYTGTEDEFYSALANAQGALEELINWSGQHGSDSSIHTTAEEKAAWNGKASAEMLAAHVNNSGIHTSEEEKAAWNNAIPSGVILLWSGAADAIPSGWHLCNGTNGTPDLRGRFIVGAGDTYAVGNTGGAESVTLSVSQIPAHTHSVKYSGNTHLDSSGSTNASYLGSTGSIGTTERTGGGNAHENRPPYYALCYIMKA